jgi:hypothetical protein
MMRVTAPVPVPGRAMAQSAARGGRERHRGPDHQHGDSSLTQHCEEMLCKAVPGPDPGRIRDKGPPGRPDRGGGAPLG